jgi:hypothetical protein
MGERLACKIVAAALRDRGIDSELVMLDAIVDASMSSVSEAALTAAGDQGVAQLGQEFYDQLAERLGERIRECGERVPVITGESGGVGRMCVTGGARRRRIPAVCCECERDRVGHTIGGDMERSTALECATGVPRPRVAA